MLQNSANFTVTKSSKRTARHTILQNNSASSEIEYKITFE